MRTALFALPILVLALAGCTDDAPADAGPTTPSARPPSTASGGPAATSSPSPPTTPSGRPPATPSARPAATPPAGPNDPLASSSPRETAPPPGLPTCKPVDLTVTDADRVYTSAAEQSLFTVRTTGPDCELQGYPVVELLDAAGAALPGTVSQGGFGLPEPAAGPVTLSRATSLSFFTATARDAAPCAQAAQLRVTLPGTPSALTAASTTRICGAAAGVGPVQRLGGAE